jgi:uncharacterized coiled-coil DUF342 family protein
VVEKISLIKEEIEAIEQYQAEIKDTLAALGSLRRQCVNSENALTDKINRLESDYKSYLKAIAKSKKIPSGENWVFNPNTFDFTKR